MKRHPSKPSATHQGARNSRRTTDRMGGAHDRSPRVAALHGAVGNAGVEELLEGNDLQPQLAVSQPDDPAEREAERVADAVMRLSTPTPVRPRDRVGGRPTRSEAVRAARQRATGERSASPTEDMCPRCTRRFRAGKPLNCEECEGALADEPIGADDDRAAVGNHGADCLAPVASSRVGRDETSTLARATVAEGDLDGLCDRCQRRFRRGTPLNCEACEATLHRATATPHQDADSGSAPARGGTERAAAPLHSGPIAGLSGGGRPLPDATRSFFEARFGRDFGDVQIHTGPQVDRTAASLQARAFTTGKDIFVRSGEYRPETREGKRLLAHELTHVVQQTGVGEGPAGSTVSRVPRATRGRLMRKLVVTKPNAPLPNAPRGSPTQTRRDAASNYLNTLCGDGVTVSKSGAVSLQSGSCTTPFGGTPTGCSCLCHLASSSNEWRIRITNEATISGQEVNWPHTLPDNWDAAYGTEPGGSGGYVMAPTPDAPTDWGTATESGTRRTIAPWLVLGHELCGHAWLADQGLMGRELRGHGGHQPTVDRENRLRAEHGIPERGDFRDPYCGESFSRDGPSGDVDWSSHLDHCKQWRRNFNMTYGTNYDISDRIPKMSMPW